MVIKLFWKDPYMKECYAKVIAIEDNKVWLDQTVFFAFSGGQASDKKQSSREMMKSIMFLKKSQTLQSEIMLK